MGNQYETGPHGEDMAEKASFPGTFDIGTLDDIEFAALEEGVDPAEFVKRTAGFYLHAQNRIQEGYTLAFIKHEGKRRIKIAEELKHPFYTNDET